MQNVTHVVVEGDVALQSVRAQPPAQPTYQPPLMVCTHYLFIFIFNWFGVFLKYGLFTVARCDHEQSTVAQNDILSQAGEINDLLSWGNRGGSVGSAFDSRPMCCRDWIIKGFGVYSRVYATGHVKDPVPLIDKRRGLSPGGRFPPGFLHQVIIITGLNKLYNVCSRPEDGLRRRQGIKPPLKTQKPLVN